MPPTLKDKSCSYKHAMTCADKLTNNWSKLMMIIGSKNQDDEIVCKEYLCLWRYDNGSIIMMSYVAWHELVFKHFLFES